MSNKKDVIACVQTLLLGAACAGGTAHAAIVVDGKIDEPEWDAAQVYKDFKITEPYSLSGPDEGSSTEARMVSTQDGIAVAFILEQSAAFRRVKPRLERDRNKSADNVNFVIDFDNDGRSAYSFTVGLSGSVKDGLVTNESSLDLDWDTDWSWAVEETDLGWQVEILIPWTVATMRDTDTPTRNVSVYFSRDVGSNGTVQAFPSVSKERGRFVSGFQSVEIPQYRTALFHYWPYATANHDFISGKTRYKTGVDLFWKPSPNFQLSATVNPDFGQVESDDLVVNFDAIETFFGDKRPFFTENQSIFTLTTPDSGRLVHTRRIGGDADDGSGASDINAAIKLNGSLGAMSYGVLAANEDGDAGRDFYAVRLQHPVSEGLSMGWLGTYTERPFLDRNATVHAFDATWKPNSELIVNAQVLGSFIDQNGNSTDDTGAWTRIDWTPSDKWSYELEATHFGKRLNFNDLGFQRRASLNELEVTAEYVRRVANEKSRLRSSVWSAELQARSNDAGDQLPTFLIFSNSYRYRSGNFLFLTVNTASSGWDDQISRGNGLWRKSSRSAAEAQFVSRRFGEWAFSGVLSLQPRGLSSDLSTNVGLTASWYPSEVFNAQLELFPEWGNDWLIWEGGVNFGRYSRRNDYASLNLSWFPGRKHELRLKSEWIAIRAENGEQYQLQPSGRLVSSGIARPDFDINNFGVQVRYRYLLGPQSDVFIAYSRGGFLRQEREASGTFDQLDEALDLRDSDQLLAKLRYRF